MNVAYEEGKVLSTVTDSYIVYYTETPGSIKSKRFFTNGKSNHATVRKAFIKAYPGCNILSIDYE